MSDAQSRAPKEWKGRFFEDFDIGDVFRSRIGRTLTEADNIWFTCVTMNTDQMHFNSHYAAMTSFKRPLVNPTLTLAIISGLSVPDTSENGAANLSWTDIALPHPVYAGDTLWAESEILALRDSRSRPNVGIVSLRSRGINQHGTTVIEFLRTFMCYRRNAPEIVDAFPTIRSDWAVGPA